MLHCAINQDKEEKHSKSLLHKYYSMLFRIKIIGTILEILSFKIKNRIDKL